MSFEKSKRNRDVLRGSIWRAGVRGPEVLGFYSIPDASSLAIRISTHDAHCLLWY